MRYTASERLSHRLHYDTELRTGLSHGFVPPPHTQLQAKAANVEHRKQARHLSLRQHTKRSVLSAHHDRFRQLDRSRHATVKALTKARPV